MDEQPVDKPRSRGIYLLPNLFTTACLFGGFYAVLAAMNGHFEKAAVAIFVAMVMDGLDGRVARLTNTQTAFGAEYDSLSDMVAFGLAPSLVMYEWALLNLGKFGGSRLRLYDGRGVAAGRFNTRSASPTSATSRSAEPVGGGDRAGGVWFAVEHQLAGVDLAIRPGSSRSSSGF